jgi:hypothetical protein
MTAPQSRMAPWEALLVAALAVAAAVVHLPLLTLTAGGCDEWHVLQIAANLNQGEVLYRDTNHIAGPGAFYGVAALFALFGERFEVGRVAMLTLFSVLVAATYCLTRRLAGPLAATLGALWLVAFRLWTLPHFHMMHYATVGIVVLTLALVVLHAERPVSLPRAVAAGLLAGTAFVTKQDSGALGTGACFVALVAGAWIRRRPGGTERAGRAAAAFVAAAATPFLLSCAYFAWHGALGPYLWQTVYDPIVLHPLYTGGGGPERGDYIDMPPLLPVFGQDAALRRFLFSWMPGLPWDLHWRDILQSRLYRETGIVDLALKIGFRLPYLVLAIEALALLRGLRRLRERPDGARALAAQAAQLAFAAGMWAAFSKPRDWIHFSILLVPFVPVVARQLAAAARLLPRWPRLIYAGALATAGIAFVVVSARLAAEAVAAYSAPVVGVRGTVWVRPEDARSFGAAVGAIAATPPDRPVLVVPCLPILTFLADRPPLSRFIFLWPRDAYADRDQQIIDALERRPDASIVYVLMHTPFAPRPQATVPQLFQYLAERYEPVEVFGRTPERMTCALAGRRAPSTAAATVRLTDRLGEARAVRTREGTSEEVPLERVTGVATWPLTPRVLHVTPGSGGESKVAIPVDVPAGARLVLRAGVNPDLWQSLGPFPVRLSVSVVADGKRTEVLSLEKDVYRHPDDRLWTPLDLDLGRWAGRRVEVVLAVEALGWKPGGGEIAGFEDPRLEVPAAGTPVTPPAPAPSRAETHPTA